MLAQIINPLGRGMTSSYRVSWAVPNSLWKKHWLLLIVFIRACFKRVKNVGEELRGLIGYPRLIGQAVRRVVMSSINNERRRFAVLRPSQSIALGGCVRHIFKTYANAVEQSTTRFPLF